MGTPAGLKPGIEAVGFEARTDSRNKILPAYVKPERVIRGIITQVSNSAAGVAWLRPSPGAPAVLVRDARPVVRRGTDARA